MSIVHIVCDREHGKMAVEEKLYQSQRASGGVIETQMFAVDGSLIENT